MCFEFIIIFAPHPILFDISEPVSPFLTPLSDQNVKPNEKATFECTVRDADAKVTWFKDGKPIKAGGKYKLFRKANIRKLVVQDCAEEEVSTYTVKCDNAESTANLQMEGRINLKNR